MVFYRSWIGGRGSFSRTETWIHDLGNILPTSKRRMLFMLFYFFLALTGFWKIETGGDKDEEKDGRDGSRIGDDFAGPDDAMDERSDWADVY